MGVKYLKRLQTFYNRSRLPCDGVFCRLCQVNHHPTIWFLREVFSFPPKLGGLGIINPTPTASEQHHASVKVTAPLVENILQQSTISQPDSFQGQIKTMVRAVKTSKLKQRMEELLPKLRIPSQLQHCIALGQEKGSSSWLTSLPIGRHSYSLHKSDFKDTIALCYDLPLQHTPSHCVCGHTFSVELALSCPTGGYTAIRHNEVRDLTASMLQETCHNIRVEPHLKALTGETMAHKTANTDPGTQLDISACGVWGGGGFERIFFDVRVFNPSA